MIPLGTTVRGPTNYWRGTLVKPNSDVMPYSARIDWLCVGHGYPNLIGTVVPLFERDFVVVSALERLAEQAE